MSRRRRSRSKRKTKPSQITSGAVRDAIGELIQVRTREGFLLLIRQRPELASSAVVQELRTAAQWPAYGPIFRRALILAEGIHRGNPMAGWAKYSEMVRTAERRLPELRALEEQIDAAAEAHQPERVVDLTDLAIPVATEIGHGLAVSYLLHRRGIALFQSTTSRREQQIEDALEALQLALRLTPPSDHRAALLMEIGLVLGERLQGDRADNLDAAVVTLREALSAVPPESNELRAMILTNLSVALGRTERGRSVAVARESAALCREALGLRSVDHNADDWAYSQINLGEALQRLITLNEADFAEARDCYEAVLAHADAITDVAIIGNAHFSLARLALLRREEAHAAAAREVSGAADNVRLDATADLEEARIHLEVARDLLENDPVRRALVLAELVEVLEQMGDDDEAIFAARDGLTVLRPTTAPHQCRDIAWSLGNILAKRGAWGEAAEAFREAVQAAEIAFYSRAEAAFRAEELRKARNLHRWAAYVVARAGDARSAAVILDAGRAREIARRVVAEDTLNHVPDELRAEYLAASAVLVTSPLIADKSHASRRLQEVLVKIRRLPGREDFGTGPSWTDVTAAVEPRWPLVYIDPTPLGTVILVLAADGGTVAADAAFASVTSGEIYLRLLAGVDEKVQTIGDIDSLDHYLSGIAGHLTDSEFRRALDELLPWFGERLARPVNKLLMRQEASGATLVLCGPLGLVPIHAATWGARQGEQCIADQFDIRYAPSSVVCGAALRRAAPVSPFRLLALADPHGDLPAACPEVTEIAAMFPEGDAAIACGMRADIDFLRRHARGVTHVHLACHARSDLWDPTDAAIVLASQDVAASQLTALARLNSRLVVASACRTAVADISDLPDEVSSIATALLASGSACAIASLWEVDDLATACLMIRLYEEMLANRRRPPEALRCAQLWLRTLGASEYRSFLNDHPILAAEALRRDNSGAEDQANPYAHPDYWAGFVAVGV